MTMYTIVRQDNMVAVDNAPLFGIDCSSLPANVHAIQWYGTWGEVEIIDPTMPYHYCIANERFTDLTPYQPLIDAYATRAAQLKVSAAPTGISISPLGSQSVIG